MHLKIPVLLICYVLSLMCVSGAPSPEEPLFELPVQLVGFPVIIAAVRVSNFVKKLAYSLSPETYRSRSKRDLLPFINQDQYDIDEIEKRIEEEFGTSVCIYSNICEKYAKLALENDHKKHNLDWNFILRRLKTSSKRERDNYLLSVFLGDIIGSPKFCHQLAKQKKICVEKIL
ncbi:uncharacterized protein LOC122507403 [Leptopilina heterotoma]|uniref:uncharacterized protein LOC122507403 n=1 Tax=Leptopilina heterotoma TaxID=63436 RepID=UPI001CA7C167|nr:uncharacterized protein LOC122507403 [Leptopilina heterotoma]